MVRAPKSPGSLPVPGHPDDRAGQPGPEDGQLDAGVALGAPGDGDEGGGGGVGPHEEAVVDVESGQPETDLQQCVRIPNYIQYHYMLVQCVPEKKPSSLLLLVIAPPTGLLNFQA